MTSPVCSSAFDAEDFADIYPEGIEHHYWNHSRNQIIAKEVRSLLATGRHGRGPRVLDVGCGRGIVTAYLRSVGIDCWGCDLGVAPHVAPGVSPFLTQGADAGHLPEEFRRTVTMILLLDVLEHLEHPTRLLEALHGAFVNAETILFTVPARQELFSNYDVRNRHFRRYDSSNIGDMNTPDCFRLQRWSYFFHGLYLPARTMKALGIDRRTDLRAPGSWPSRLAHKLVAAGFVVEDTIVPGTWPGSSIRGVLCRVGTSEE
jgi:SAM-dependent methyltransferase